MLLLIDTYLKKVARGRWNVVLGLELILSVVIVLVVAVVCCLNKYDFLEETPFVVSKLAETLNTYCRFGFGTTFAVLVLAGRWASFKMSVKYILESNDDYDAIIFRLSWTAFVDLGAMFVGKIASFVTPVDLVFPNAQNMFTSNALCLFLLFLFCYSLLLSCTFPTFLKKRRKSTKVDVYKKGLIRYCK